MPLQYDTNLVVYTFFTNCLTQAISQISMPKQKIPKPKNEIPTPTDIKPKYLFITTPISKTNNPNPKNLIELVYEVNTITTHP